MKNLLFLCGPNGIGKTTICKKIVEQSPGVAYVDSDPCRFMNPFILNETTIPTIAKNITDLIINYMACPIINTVIFSYGFHGRRKEIFDIVMSNLEQVNYTFIPFLLWCDETENIRRMKTDNRSLQRIQIALDKSRKSFCDVKYPIINISKLTVSEASSLIIKNAKLK